MEDAFKAYQVAYGKAMTGKKAFSDVDYGDRDGKMGGWRAYSEEERTAVNIAINDAKQGKPSRAKEDVYGEIKRLLGK